MPNSQEQSMNEIREILMKDDRLVSDDGKLLKNKAAELARKLDEDLLELLLDNDKTQNQFFTNVNDTAVFDKNAFVDFIYNKNFLPDSYTKFSQNIGLTFGDAGDRLKNVKDVVLSWPYKDCVLEGGQTKEDVKRKEVFWNETLAADEITRLKEPKVLTGWKRTNESGEVEVEELAENDDGTLDENLVLQGNNLLALHSLKDRYAGKVNLIYIDPPFNTGNDSFKYNDRFNHSTWLTFMKNRLEVARELLADDGSIYVHLDDNEAQYCKVLMDEVFGENNFRNIITWRRQVVRGMKVYADYMPDSSDFILFYGKSDNTIWNRLEIENEITVEEAEKKYQKDEHGYFRTSDRGTYSDEKIIELDKENRIYVTHGGELVIEDGEVSTTKGSIGIKYYREQRGDKVIEKTVPDNIWDDIPGMGVLSGQHIGLAGQKPEQLVKRIIAASSNKGDTVLDFFAGSGTTGAVAHKMNRRYILIEQMQDQVKIIEDRLKRVVDGDTAGISEDVGWGGGGSFVSAKLMEWNERWRKKIKSATKDDLKIIWEEMQKKAHLSWRVDLEEIDEEANVFEDLKKEDMQRFLLETLNNNHLYVNYADITDETYNVSEGDKGLNQEFYG